MPTEYTDYADDEDLAIALDSLISMGADIKSTTQLSSGNWEIKYEL